MQFIHQALTWGFLLALLPLLIHLINMMRHRRVKWAAMEFLLASYKKHRKWVWLKQLLLLLSRVAAIVLIVAMLAQLKTRDQWLAIFGARSTHHYVLLDDSYSMSDRVAGASAMDAARQVIAAIAARAEQEDSPQKLTVIRYSQARDAGGSRPPGGISGAEPSADSGAAGPAAPPAAQIADFNAEPIDASFDLALERKMRGFEPTQLAVGPRDALAVLKPLLAQAKDETSIVYVLSDFRKKDWDSPAELRESLQELERAGADIHLVNCARSSEPNLGIVALEPADETRAAGVPLFVNVRVKNFGARAVSKVQLKVQATFYPPEDLSTIAADTLAGTTEELATLLIDQIGPGETVARRVQVYFPQPGKHVVEASLPEDPVEADNRRWAVIDFPDGERTLVIDGTVDQLHAYYLEVAFRPLERSNTGIRPEVKPAALLRDTPAEALNAYSTIYLLDVPRLDPKAVDSLEAYVKGGGGLAIFVGPEASTTFYNSALYKEGLGLLPMPLGPETELPPVIDAAEPDMELTRHPVFSFFLSETNPLIRGVKIDRYRRPADAWQPSPDHPVEVIARLRDRAPLAVEKKFGRGSVLLYTTTCAPLWNDWAKNPSFVVVVLKTQSYLATANRLDDPRLVGTPLDLVLDGQKFLGDLAFVRPGERPGSRVKIERHAAPPEAGAATLVASLGRGLVESRRSGETDHRGVYEAWPRTTKGEIDLRRWAFNVDPDEGDLTALPSPDLLARLDPVKVHYHAADQYQQEEIASTGYNLSYLLMGLLVALLVGEQLLAYSASYHVTPGGAR